jgi:hypothetical protein
MPGVLRSRSVRAQSWRIAPRNRWNAARCSSCASCLCRRGFEPAVLDPIGLSAACRRAEAITVRVRQVGQNLPTPHTTGRGHGAAPFFFAARYCFHRASTA